MSIRIYNGRWLLNGSSLATGDDCCCEYPPDTPGACCGFGPENCTLTISVSRPSASDEYVWDFATSEWVGPPGLTGVSYDPATCLVTYSEADTPFVGSCESWSAAVQATVLCQECCDNSTGVGCTLGEQSFTSSQNTDCSSVVPTGMTLALNCAGDSCCGGPCQWQPVWLLDGTWGGGWEQIGYCAEGCECPEPDVEGVGTESSPAQAEPYVTSCAAMVEPMSLNARPGAELKALLASFGITASPTCSCNKMAAQMDAWGPEESLAHIEQIVDVMQETARSRKLPFLRLVGRKLVRVACNRARKKSAQTGQ